MFARSHEKLRVRVTLEERLHREKNCRKSISTIKTQISLLYLKYTIHCHQHIN
jgi:hypothetical protein